MLLAIDEVLKTEDQDANNSMMRLLERIWQRDQSLGIELPWERLGDDEIRLVLAEHLAQHVRWGHSNLPLNELRELALRQAIDGRGNRSDAIRLLGLADVGGQAPFLKSVIETSASASERYAAIQALGMMCDTETNEVLVKLTARSALDPAESSAVAESLRRRATWVKDLCVHTARASRPSGPPDCSKPSHEP
jgi:hypothetical protein